jgi:hypothetical protein
MKILNIKKKNKEMELNQQLAHVVVLQNNKNKFLKGKNHQHISIFLII